MYYRFINLVVSRPLPILLATLLLTGWFAWQLPSIRTDSDARSYLGKDDPVGQALDRMEDIFGEQDLFIILVLRRDHRDGIYIHPRWLSSAKSASGSSSRTSTKPPCPRTSGRWPP